MHIIKQFSLIMLLPLTLLFAGCSSSAPAGPDVAQLNADANVKLAESATTISNTLTNMGAVQRATTSPLAMRPLANPNAYNMDMLASVDWSGPVEPIVQSIANAANYRLRVLGNPPPIPVLVSVNERNEPLGYILRDVDFQCGSKANIVVLPQTNTIELRYARS